MFVVVYERRNWSVKERSTSKCAPLPRPDTPPAVDSQPTWSFKHDPHWQTAMRSWRAGAFWQAHEDLEPLWIATAPGADKRRLRAVIQLFAALHKPEQAARWAAERRAAAPRDFRAGARRILERVAANWTPTGDAEVDAWVEARWAEARAFAGLPCPGRA